VIKKVTKIVALAIGEAIMESIMEFGFDALDSLNEGSRPAFGSKSAFFGIMIGMTVLGAISSKKQSGLNEQVETKAHRYKENAAVYQFVKSLYTNNLASQSFWLKYSSQLSVVMMGIMWLSISPTLLSYLGG
jgi:hypothetical protein